MEKMLEEVEYCKAVVKKHFNTPLVMTEDDEQCFRTMDEYKVNLLLITKDEKKHYVLIKDFNSFMYDQSKHKERKHFCMYCLQFFLSV